MVGESGLVSNEAVRKTRQAHARRVFSFWLRSGTGSLLRRAYRVRHRGIEAWSEAPVLNRIFAVCALAGILLSGSYPAMAQPAQPEAGDQVKKRLKAGSEQFRARLEEAAHALENNPRLKNLSQQQRKDLVEFVGGNMLFVLAKRKKK
jgi:hypothetical protein